MREIKDTLRKAEENAHYLFGNVSIGEPRMMSTIGHTHGIDKSARDT